MRKALLVGVSLTVGGPALAQEPAAPPPQPEQPAPAPAPAPVDDPAYGERPDPADGGGSYFAAPKGKDIVVKMHPDRSRRNVTGLLILGGAGLVVSGVGLVFHLDSKSATEEVGAHKFTGETWTPERQDVYERAHRSAIAAGVFYGIGGGLLIGTAIAYMVTEPKMETTVIHPHVAIGPSGAMVGGGWQF